MLDVVTDYLNFYELKSMESKIWELLPVILI